MHAVSVAPPRRLRLSRSVRVVATLAFSLLIALVIGARLLGYDRDYEGYIGIYDLSDFERSQLRYEALFNWLISQCQSLGFGFPLFLIVVAVLSIVPKWFAIRYFSLGNALPFVFYGSYFLVIHDSTQIRAALATTVLFVAAALADSRRFLPALIALAIATGFHVQAILAGLLIAAFMLLNHPATRTLGRHASVIAVGAASAVAYWLLTGGFALLLAQFPQIEMFALIEDFAGARWYQPVVLQTLTLLLLAARSVASMTPIVKATYFTSLSGVVLYYALGSLSPAAFRITETLLVFNALWLGYAATGVRGFRRILIYAAVLIPAPLYVYLFYTSTPPYLRFSL